MKDKEVIESFSFLGVSYDKCIKQGENFQKNKQKKQFLSMTTKVELLVIQV